MLFGSLCLLLIGRTTGPVEAQQAVDAPAIGTLVAAEAAALPLSASYFAPSHTYRYSASDIPADQVAEQAPERTVRFGDEVSLRFAGLDPMASYSIQIGLSRSKRATICSMRVTRSRNGRCFDRNLRYRSQIIPAETSRLPFTRRRAIMLYYRASNFILRVRRK